jgi:hypothetical protein
VSEDETEDIQVLKTYWDHIAGEEKPLFWIEKGMVVYAPRSNWEAENLFVNGFRWRGGKTDSGILTFKDDDTNQGRSVAFTTSHGGIG